MKAPLNGIVYKFLGPGRKPCHGGRGAWPEPGVWTPRLTDLVPCEHGYHVCRAHQLLDWLGPELWSGEWRGKSIEAFNKIVVGEARLIGRIEEWNERTARLFACDCAERVIRFTGPDARCTHVVVVARRFADGEVTEKEMAAAWDAVGDAAWDAVRDSARDATRCAAKAAAKAAAWDAARTAARAAAWAAAGDAARYAAGGTARYAAGDAARDAERLWQIARLLEILGIKSDA